MLLDLRQSPVSLQSCNRLSAFRSHQYFMVFQLKFVIFLYFSRDASKRKLSFAFTSFDVGFSLLLIEKVLPLRFWADLCSDFGDSLKVNEHKRCAQLSAARK